MRAQSGTCVVLVLLSLFIVHIKQEGSGSLVAPVFVSTSSHMPVYVEVCGSAFGAPDSCAVVSSPAQRLSQEIVDRVKDSQTQLFVKGWLATHELCSGQKLTITADSQSRWSVATALMDASSRIVLKIPLTLDRMQREDWQAIPGIGEKLAGKIEAFRRLHGGFDSVEGLLDVDGISFSKLEKLRPYFQ